MNNNTNNNNQNDNDNYISLYPERLRAAYIVSKNVFRPYSMQLSTCGVRSLI